MNKIVHGSTFSGIGAPEVAAEMLGWQNAFHCEINPFGREVLDYYFPNSESYEDITKTDFSPWRGKITVLTGGFPCQPFSYAGKRRGSEDDRYLWPFMLRCIDQIRPTWFVGENVAGITTMVFPCEDAKVGEDSTLFGTSDRMERRERYVIEEICQQLEDIGYSVQPMLIPACAVGAPHRRDRVFFIAHRNDDVEDTMHCGLMGREHDEQGSVRNIGNTCPGSNERICGEEGTEMRPTPHTDSTGQPTPNGQSGRERQTMDGECERKPFDGTERPCAPSDVADTQSQQGDGLRPEQSETRKPKPCQLGGGDCEDDCSRGNASHTNGSRLQDADDERGMCSEGRQAREDHTRNDFADGYLLPENRWRTFPTVSPVYRGNDGLPFDVDNLTIPFARWKKESLKAYGNAIVVQVMYEIFRAIETIENQKQHKQ